MILSLCGPGPAAIGTFTTLVAEYTIEVEKTEKP